MTSRPRLLIVDDDADLRQLIVDYLRGQDFDVEGAENGAAMDIALCRAAATGASIDLIILDVMMPGDDGLRLCARLAGSGPPILMLSARGDQVDRIVGLELGADDYMAKPFHPRELSARIRAILRRRAAPADSVAPQDRNDGHSVTFCGYQLDLIRRTVRRPNGASLSLSTSELALLQVFLTHAGRTLSREALLDALHGDEALSFDRAIDVQVSRLRRKLRPGDEPGLDLIRTVRGEGYVFDMAIQAKASA